MDTSRRARGASKRTYVDESENENESGDNFSEEEHGPRKKTRSEKRVVSPDSDSENMNEEDDLNGIPGIRTTPYEAGQILTVSVENFMCHRKFVVQLGRHLNFITGRNGSGSFFYKSCFIIICFVLYQYFIFNRKVCYCSCNSIVPRL